MTKFIPVQVNEKGYRIGESHPKALLSDDEVDALLKDRGPQEAPAMTYRQLAKKYKVSVSSVAMICRGERRYMKGVRVQREPSHYDGKKKVELRIRVSLKARHYVWKKGGGAWLNALILMASEQEKCTTDDGAQCTSAFFEG